VRSGATPLLARYLKLFRFFWCTTFARVVQSSLHAQRDAHSMPRPPAHCAPNYHLRIKVSGAAVCTRAAGSRPGKVTDDVIQYLVCEPLVASDNPLTL
jgi:hypothetical protein